MAKNVEGLKIEQVQTLGQRLNPQLARLGQILEMNVPEFEEAVARELNENPALEDLDSHSGDHEDNSIETPEDIQRGDYADEDDMPVYLARNHSADDSHVDVASYAPDEGDTISDVLLRRLFYDHNLSDSEKSIAEHIVGNLDESGYLTRSVGEIADDIAEKDGVNVRDDEVRIVLDYVRALDPAGIAAFDLRDCLLLQLNRMTDSETADCARRIVRDYYDLFTKKHFDRIQMALGASREMMEDALRMIRKLNTRPASVIETGNSIDKAPVVYPDYILTYDADFDTFTLSLSGNNPELAIEASFRIDDALLKKEGASVSEFIRTQRDRAQSFIELVKMRRNTMMEVGKAIVKLQREFFVTGDKTDMKPMILADIQRITGLDPSVISRATSGKYILTPHGQFAMKTLFNERVDDSSDITSLNIKEKLTDIINNEDKRHPFSDRALCELLKAAGFDIARRTVAKYRESLGFPVGRLRRNF